MSLYEALDNFVGAGVLTCAGMVDVEMPADHPLDGAGFSRHLRAHRLGDTFGAALDGLAHAIWMVQETHGFSQAVSEAHAIALGRLLSEIRLDQHELTAAIEGTLDRPASRANCGGRNELGHRIADAWYAKAASRGAMTRFGMVEDVARFILGCMFTEVTDRHRLLQELKGTLRTYRDGLAGGTPAQLVQPDFVTADTPAPPLDATQAPAKTALPPSQSTAVAVRHPDPTTVRSPLPGVLETSTAPQPETPTLTDGALQRFMAILAQHPMTTQQRHARLEELTAWLSATVAVLRRPSNAPATMQRIKVEAAAALEAGDLEQAMDLLKNIRERLRDERRGAEARIAEELSNLRLTMLDEAAATARLGELAMARMDFPAAAEFYADAAGQLPAKETGLEYDYRQRHAEALAGHAETTGDARVLEAAAQAFRQCRRLLVRERDPGSWVRASVGLGDMLMGLATRSSHPEIPLEEAVISFAEAVEVIDRNAKPRQWGLVQMSYASALIEQGRHHHRERHWRHATTVLLQTLEVLEPLGAAELCNAARHQLQQIASSLDDQSRPPAPLRVIG